MASLEIFTPGGAGSWSAPKALPFNYFYYPWTFLLPNGEIFIAGPQKPARRVDWTATPVVDDPARQYPQVFSQRGVNMDGTAVLLPLRPPSHAPRVLIAGGAIARHAAISRMDRLVGRTRMAGAAQHERRASEGEFGSAA